MATLEQTLRQDADSVLSTALDATSVPSGARSILMAAACLFARKGYGPTSVRTIASAADVTVPMVYYYFDGKEQIFVTLFDCLGRDFFARLNAVTERPVGDKPNREEQEPSFREELVEVARVFRSLLYPCPVTLQLMTQFVFGPPESRPPIDNHVEHEQVDEFFRDMFESAAASGRFQPTPGFEPSDLSVFFINVVHSHTMYAMKQLERPDADDEAIYRECLADQALERLVDIFLRGAGESSSPA